MDMTGQVLHKNPASGQARTEPAAGEAPLRIAALGWCGAGNLGNDGMLEALTNFIRREYPDAQITAVCAGPEDVKARLGVEAVQMRWEPQSWPLRALNKLALKTPSALFNWLYTQRDAPLVRRRQTQPRQARLRERRRRSDHRSALALDGQAGRRHGPLPLLSRRGLARLHALDRNR
jgi:hypothetical protein